jgi:hypothetical protein
MKTPGISVLVRERRNKHDYGLGTWEREQHSERSRILKSRLADVKCEGYRTATKQLRLLQFVRHWTKETMQSTCRQLGKADRSEWVDYSIGTLPWKQ